MTNWTFANEHGKILNPNEFIFPLTSPVTPKQPFRVIGTAFMIAQPAIFLTARHCLYFDDACTDPIPEMMGLFHHLLPFRWCQDVAGTDVAIGQLDTSDSDCTTCKQHPVFNTCTWTPIKREKIVHWGCDLTEVSILRELEDGYDFKFSPKVRGSNGHYIETLDKYPPFTHSECHVTSAYTPHSASGGPVTVSTGQVVGISTSSSEGFHYSIASLVKDVFEAPVPPHFRLNAETKGRKQTWGDLLAGFGIKILKGE